MRASALALLGLLAFISGAQAAVTGEWQGAGTWAFQGSSVDCAMKIEYREDDAKLARVGGYFNCGLVGMHSDPLTWKKEADGKLSIDGKPAGTISEKGFETSEDYGDGVTVHTKLEHDGRVGTYEERWVNEKGTEIYLINGSLKLKERLRP